MEASSEVQSPYRSRATQSHEQEVLLMDMLDTLASLLSLFVISR
jgi:hypothetical protein